MVIHYVKDLLKKIEDIDRKLSISLEKDEIQTLGLKLRFYTTEVNHYIKLLKGSITKIEEVQRRYGFISESEVNTSVNEKNEEGNERLQTKDIKNKGEKSWEDYISEAEGLYSHSNIEEAIKKLNYVVENNLVPNIGVFQNYASQKNQNNPSNKFCKGYILMKFGFIGSAINLFEDLLEENENLFTINLFLADCYFEKEIYNRALFYYKKAHELNKEDENAILGLCKSNLEIGNYNEVVKLLSELKEISKDMKILKIKALIKLKKFEFANKEIEELDTLNDMQATVCKLRGEIKESSNDVLSAIDFYEQALLLNPFDFELRYKVGEIYLKNNAIMLAKNHFNFIIKNMPESRCSDKSRRLLYGSNY